MAALQFLLVVLMLAVSASAWPKRVSTKESAGAGIYMLIVHVATF